MTTTPKEAAATDDGTERNSLAEILALREVADRVVDPDHPLTVDNLDLGSDRAERDDLDRDPAATEPADDAAPVAGDADGTAEVRYVLDVPEGANLHVPEGATVEQSATEPAVDATDQDLGLDVEQLVSQTAVKVCVTVAFAASALSLAVGAGLGVAILPLAGAVVAIFAADHYIRPEFDADADDETDDADAEGSA